MESVQGGEAHIPARPFAVGWHSVPCFIRRQSEGTFIRPRQTVWAEHPISQVPRTASSLINQSVGGRISWQMGKRVPTPGNTASVALQHVIQLLLPRGTT